MKQWLKGSAAIATAATAWSAWLGAGAAAVSFTAALSGIGIPILAIGSLAGFFTSIFKKRQHDDRSFYIQELRAAFQQFRRETILPLATERANEIFQIEGAAVVTKLVDDFYQTANERYTEQSVTETLRSLDEAIDHCKLVHFRQERLPA
ncbi:MAG: hypothetical protein M5R36_05530 [Deltaproteobacteria bacterium]|nr:hypothetical protein [Deltaproteobacteria bacterium]